MIDCVTVTSESQNNSQAIYFPSPEQVPGGLWRSRDLVFVVAMAYFRFGKGAKRLRGSSHFQRAARMCNHPEKCENNSYSKSRAHTDEHSLENSFV